LSTSCGVSDKRSPEKGEYAFAKSLPGIGAIAKPVEYSIGRAYGETTSFVGGAAADIEGVAWER
jgi:hypothetical protein